MTKAKILVKGPGEKSDLELLVDTGSLYTWVSEELLKRLGISPTSHRKFTTIEGRRLERPIGEALIEYDGESAHCVVVFAHPSDVNVMGVTAKTTTQCALSPSYSINASPIGRSR